MNRQQREGQVLILMKNRKLTHAEISENRSTLETLGNVTKLPVVVLLNSIRSSYNVGSIFRSSDGAQIEKIILSGYTPTPEKKEVLKTALGATESIEWVYSRDGISEVLSLKSRGYNIIALEQTETSLPYYDLSADSFPLCLIIGNEITGVSQDLLNLCDQAIEIPQFGIKQSLNVAVAYGIALYDLRRIFNNRF